MESVPATDLKRRHGPFPAPSLAGNSRIATKVEAVGTLPGNQTTGT